MPRLPVRPHRPFLSRSPALARARLAGFARTRLRAPGLVLAAALAGLGAGALSGHAQPAAPVRDQATCGEPWAGTARIAPPLWKAQTFVPGLDGRLAAVDLPGASDGGTVTLHLRLTVDCDVPAPVDIAVASAAQGTRLTFPDPPVLRRGAVYALAVSYAGPGFYHWAYSNRPDCYADPRGTSFTSGDGGSTWTRDVDDIHFATWMLPDASVPTATASPRPSPTPTPWPTPLPGTPSYTVVDQASCADEPVASVQVGGDVWKAQTFAAGADGALRAVALPGTHTGGTTVLRVREVDARGFPAGPDLGSAVVGCGSVFEFPAGVRLRAGRMYALCVSNAGSASGFWWGYSGRTDCVAAPAATSYTSLDAGASWSRDVLDIHFKTYVLPDRPGGVPATPAPSHGCERPPLAGPGTVVAVAGAVGPDGAARRDGAPHGAPAVDRSAAEDRTVRAAVARADARPPAAARKTVLVISLPTGRYDPEPLLAKSRDLAALFKEASAYHGYKDPDARPAVEYVIYQDRVFLEPEMPPRCGKEPYDLGYLYAKHDVCRLVRQGLLDEVWLWEGATGGLLEWAVNGPEWSATYGSRIPSCGRQVAVMAFHNGIDLGYALHSLGHRMESTLRVYRPCDISTSTWPWPAVAAGCRDGTASDRTGYVARPSPANGHVGACGDVHHPPNIAQGVDGEYDYDNPAAARSICEDWRRDGSAAVKEVTCAAWDCTQTGYMLWWFQNLPGIANTSRDHRGEPMPDWWPFFFGRLAPTPEPATPPGTAEPTATPAVPTATPTRTSTVTPIATPDGPATPTATPFRAVLPLAARHWVVPAPTPETPVADRAPY